MGGVSIAVLGLIAVADATIWADNRVDFRDNRNPIVAAIGLILGTGDYTLRIDSLAINGIGHRDLWRAVSVAMLLLPCPFVGRGRPARAAAAADSVEASTD